LKLLERSPQKPTDPPGKSGVLMCFESIPTPDKSRQNLWMAEILHHLGWLKHVETL
jgi:hypothetical protein